MLGIWVNKYRKPNKYAFLINYIPIFQPNKYAFPIN